MVLAFAPAGVLQGHVKVIYRRQWRVFLSFSDTVNFLWGVIFCKFSVKYVQYEEDHACNIINSDLPFLANGSSACLFLLFYGTLMPDRKSVV